MKISAELKKAVNTRYKLLEIDLDGVFQRLLLLQKKKYAAIKVEDGGTRTSTEVKGLDMKRREYCALSKAVSQYVLDQILSGEPTEVVVEKIHEYLTKIGEDVRAGQVKLDEFIIFKRLGKAPEDYPDAKSQPHVQVALKMKTRGGSARAGDVIPYIFCIHEGIESGKMAQAERARHPDELRKSAEVKIGTRACAIFCLIFYVLTNNQITSIISQTKSCRRSSAYASPLKAQIVRVSPNAWVRQAALSNLGEV
jgi:DNA polymerase alpha subunit A